MSQEIQVSGSLTYTNPAVGITSPVGLSLPNTFFDIIGSLYADNTMSVPTTAGGTAIPLAQVVSLGWAFFRNTDVTNYVDILTAVSGTAIIRLLPGEIALFRFNSAITAPAALAHTAVCLMQYLILAA